MVGSGTSGDPFRNTQTNNNLPVTSNQGNQQVTDAGPLSSFTFRFFSTLNSKSGHWIGVLDLSFCG